MSKFLSLASLVFAALIAITISGPALAKLASALVPLVLVAGIVVALLRAVWFFTR